MKPISTNSNKYSVSPVETSDAKKPTILSKSVQVLKIASGAGASYLASPWMTRGASMMHRTGTAIFESYVSASNGFSPISSNLQWYALSQATLTTTAASAVALGGVAITIHAINSLNR